MGPSMARIQTSQPTGIPGKKYDIHSQRSGQRKLHENQLGGLNFGNDGKHASPGHLVKDPVCGMDVDSQTAKQRRHQGIAQLGAVPATVGKSDGGDEDVTLDAIVAGDRLRVHCRLGDAMIAGLSLHLALAVFGRATWPRARVARVFIPSLAFGVGYTIYSEWLNIHVRGRWAYSDLMPVVPVIGTGLAPLLQGFVVPTLALWVEIGRAPRVDDC